MSILSWSLHHIFIGTCSITENINFHSRIPQALNNTPMSTRKKNLTQRSSTHSLKKSSTKHSRKPTCDYPTIDPSSLLIYHFRLSKQTHQNNLLANKIDALVFDWPQIPSRVDKQVLLMVKEQEQIREYYMLSKHQKLNDEVKNSIESSLTSAIRKNGRDNNRYLLPHFGGEVYYIVRNYHKMIKQYTKKIQGSSIPINNYTKKYPKELTTVISLKQQPLKTDKPHTLIHHSQSFQLKMLSNCIKKMFEKQVKVRDQLGISKVSQSSWLKGLRSNDRLPSIQCDFSSIQMHSKVDLMLESRVKTATLETDYSQPQELYGLTDLKKKYTQQKMLQFSNKNKKLGHKRNPTDGIPLKKQYYFDPMTPKQQTRYSALASTKNIPINFEHDRSHSKGKDSIGLNFKKTKKKGTNLAKQNKLTVKSRSKVTSSSHSKDRLQLKSPTIKRKL